MNNSSTRVHVLLNLNIQYAKKFILCAFLQGRLMFIGTVTMNNDNSATFTKEACGMAGITVD